MTMKTILKKLLNVKYIIIKKVELLEEIATLKVYVGMTKGKRGRCPICNRKCPYYDTVSTNREWKSIDFGPFKVLIVAHTRRVCCSEHGIHTEAVPWVYHNSRFTKDFEQYASYLALHLNKTEAAKLLRISWNTIGPILSRTKKRMEPDMNSRFEGVTRIGIDETSYRKGHKYVTVVLDHDKNQVIWVGKGTGIEVLTQFF